MLGPHFIDLQARENKTMGVGVQKGVCHTLRARSRDERHE